MRFSLIIPIYNGEKYIKKCLESIKTQTFSGFEAILVNDGSTDCSQEIIDSYVLEKPNIFKTYKKNNGGQSSARNLGVQKAKGEYIIFIDSDDYIENNYLETLNNTIENEKDIDLIRITIKKLYENGEIYKTEEFVQEKLSGEEAFLKARKEKIEIDLPWSYCIKMSFWKDNNFMFSEGKIHEDFALMPIMLIKASKVNLVNGSYYVHIFRKNSTMRSSDNVKKRAYDVLYHYENIIKEVSFMNNTSKRAKNALLEYISTGVFSKLKILPNEERIEYLKEIKKRKIIKNVKFYKGCFIRILGKKIKYRLVLLGILK